MIFANALSFFLLILFADDTYIFCFHNNIKTLNKIINQELNNVSIWLRSNKLSLNVKKTQFILFKTRQKKANETMSIKINGQEIKNVESTKFLGIHYYGFESDMETSYRLH